MPKKDSKPYQVLIMEDNEGDCFLIQEYLQETILSPKTIAITSFSELEQLKSKSKLSNVNVILLDLSLPDKSGIELISSTTEILPHVPIIVLTGYSDLDFAVKSLSLGVSDYLLKDELNATILYKSIIYNIERNKNLLKLKESELKYSNLFQLSPTPTIVFDIKTLRCIKTNSAATDLYGFNSDEFKNLSLLTLFETDNFNALFQDIIMNPSISGNTYLGRFKQLKKNGEPIVTNCYFSPIQFNNNKSGLIIIVDITEKEMLENRISKAIIQAVENEHYDIGAELHDNVCQTLVAGKMHLNITTSLLEGDALDYVHKTIQFISTALKDIQSLSHRLAPAYFKEVSIEESFSKLCNTFNTKNILSIEINTSDEVKKINLNEEIHLNLYRVLQEQLRNILKHAQASKVIVNIGLEDDLLSMQIIDDGIGFNLDGSKKGIGLMNMRRRIELLSGSFNIITSPKNGCQLHIQIPTEAKQEAMMN